MSDPSVTRNVHSPAVHEDATTETSTLAAAFQHAMIGIAIGTADGRLMDVNPAFVQMLGQTRDGLLGQPISAITHPDDRSADARQWNRLASGEIDAYQRDKRYLRLDGSVLWGLVTVSALRDESGRFIGSSAQIQDITAQKTAEAALREHEARLESLVEQLPVALYSQPWGGPHTFGYISPQFTRHTGLARDELPTTFRQMLEQCHPDDAAHVAAVNKQADETGEPALAQYRLRGGHGEWVWIDHRSVLTRDDQGRPLAWHGSLLDISERKRLEASLQESEERFRFAFSDAAIGMAISGPDDICLDANAAYCEIVGIPRAELIGRPIVSVTHPSNQVAAMDRLERLRRGEFDSYAVEKRYLRADGREVIGQLTISAVRDEAGALRYCIGQLQDITAQKSTEAALRESEEILRSVMAQAPAAVYRLTPGANGQFTYASPRFKTLTGLTLEHGVAKPSDFFPRVHPDDLTRLMEADARAAKDGESFDIEYRLRGEDGSWVWVHDRSTPSRDASGRIVAWHGVLIDISERKRLEAALRENEARVQALIEHLPVALYSVEPLGQHYSYTSPQFEQITGLTPADQARGIPALDDRIHPADLEAVDNLTSEANATGKPAELEYRVLGANGDWRWVHDRSTLALDDHGNPLAWHGVILDISERKHLEEALAEREQRLRLLVEQLPVAVYSLEVAASRRYLYVSPRFGDLTGMSPAEIDRGSEALFERIHPDDVELVREADRLSDATQSHHAVSFRVRHPDGSWAWLQERATLALDDQGQPLAWHGVLLDISEQRRLEHSLRESEERFRSTFEGAAIGMALSTPDCRVIMANPALERLLGFGPDELNGVYSDERTYSADLEQDALHRQRLATGDIEGYHLEKRYVRKDQEIVWVAQTVTAIRDDRGAIQAVIAQIQDITDRKAAEAALRESEARFRSTFEGAGIGMSLADEHGRYLDANPAFCRMVGRSRDDLTQLTYVDITHPDDQRANIAQVERLKAGEIDGYAMEKRYLHPAGHAVWGQLTVTAVRGPDDAFLYEIAQIEDITARKAAEAALQASEARFRALVQHDPDVVIIVDDAFSVTYVSPSAESAFGVPLAEILGTIDASMHWIHPEDLEQALALHGKIGARPGVVASTEVRIKHVRKGWLWFEMSIANLLEDPGICGYMINLRDITERKRAELATATALKAQQAAITELERLNQSKSRFLSTISHEFRTPLTAITGYSEFLASHASDAAAVKEDAAVINREARRLNRMVDDVLLLDRVDARRISLVRQPVDLGAIAREVIETFRPLTEQHELVLHLDPAVPLLVADEDRLSQALTNLVTNAIKYSPAGGRIVIGLHTADDQVIISVRDEGIGIAAADQQRIFDRFERVESGNAGRVPGTGLGLSIVREIAALHGGRAWVESEPGSGSLFSIAIPIQPPDGIRPLP